MKPGASSFNTDYFRAIQGLPVPTPEQTRNFASHVAGAHSWHKHLPLLPPAAPFVFYLDPHAGQIISWCEWQPDPPMTTKAAAKIPRFQLLIEDRVRGKPRHHSHYSDVPTIEYREQFGYWQYASLDWDLPDSKTASPKIYNPEGLVVTLPDEILQHCSCLLTAFLGKQYAPRIVGSLKQLDIRLASGLDAIADGWNQQRNERYVALLKMLLEARREVSGADGHCDVHIKEDFIHFTTLVNRVHKTTQYPVGDLVVEERKYQLEILSRTLKNSREWFGNLLPGQLGGKTGS